MLWRTRYVCRSVVVDCVFASLPHQLSGPCLCCACLPLPNALYCCQLCSQTIKNHFASEYIYNRYKNEKTCGVVERDPVGGIIKIAEPVGVVAGESLPCIVAPHVYVCPCPACPQ